MTRGRLAPGKTIHWDGGCIVRPAMVEAFRPIPALPKGRRTAVDVRQFVSSTANAVVAREARKALDEAVGTPSLGVTREQLATPAVGAFDLRAMLLLRHVSARIKYDPRDGEYFQLPEETLSRKAGDCEDRAILLAAMLVGAGISQYNVRVVLGHVLITGGPKPKRAAHAWVMYKDELGDWLLLDIPAGRRAKTPPDAKEVSFAYEPDFLFNGDHLWIESNQREDIPSPEAVRRRWNELDPTFYGVVHRSIVDAAFESDAVLKTKGQVLHALLRQKFSVLFGQVIDTPDRSLGEYDPRDHFDNGLIRGSLERLDTRLTTFYSMTLNHPQGVKALCFAVHAIADFYAHSSYAHFARAAGHAPTPYTAAIAAKLRFHYGKDPAYAKLAAKYEPNTRWFKGSAADALALWEGEIISGRYSQPRDGRSAIERLSAGIKEVVKGSAARSYAGSLPHHNDIAVDSRSAKKNALYEEAEYVAQFDWRVKAATKHVAQAIAAHPAFA